MVALSRVLIRCMCAVRCVICHMACCLMPPCSACTRVGHALLSSLCACVGTHVLGLEGVMVTGPLVHALCMFAMRAVSRVRVVLARYLGGAR